MAQLLQTSFAEFGIGICFYSDWENGIWPQNSVQEKQSCVPFPSTAIVRVIEINMILTRLDPQNDY